MRLIIKFNMAVRTKYKITVAVVDCRHIFSLEIRLTARDFKVFFYSENTKTLCEGRVLE